MADLLRWGIISTGSIAHTFARALAGSTSGRLVAVASRAAAPAAAFAGEFGAVRAHGSYEALLADPEVEAVYIAPPHPFHAEWCLKAAAAGKHILCEKPLTMTHASTLAVVEAARASGVCLLEGFMYRFHPQIAKLRALLEGGAIGEVRAVQAVFSFCAPADPTGRLLAKALGGGGILDVGCYTVSFARLVAGAARGQPFAEPEKVKATGYLGTTRVDEWSAVLLGFPGGLVAELACGVRLDRGQDARVFGSAGSIRLASPWFSEGGTEAEMLLQRRGEKTESIEVEPGGDLYRREADAFAAAVRAGKLEVSEMTPADSLGNARTLDRWRAEVGLAPD